MDASAWYKVVALHTLNTSHSPFFSAPEKLAALIAGA